MRFISQKSRPIRYEINELILDDGRHVFLNYFINDDETVIDTTFRYDDGTDVNDESIVAQAEYYIMKNQNPEMRAITNENTQGDTGGTERTKQPTLRITR